jgi:hypothetical protein
MLFNVQKPTFYIAKYKVPSRKKKKKKKKPQTVQGGRLDPAATTYQEG